MENRTIYTCYTCNVENSFICTPIGLHYGAMAPSEVEKLIGELREWVDAGYGRRAELARDLGVPRQRITDWLSGRKAPTLEQGLKIANILRGSPKGKRTSKRGYASYNV